MSNKVDVIIRGGTVVDGTGGGMAEADVAVNAGRIVEVGKVRGSGREEIDARGKLVTPGFVDIHTHFDGQATWDNRLTPSSWHGVTTAVMGNCGVGFAPCRPDDREQLIELMEGVEDIPEIVMTRGIPWGWTSFPDYLDFLGNRQFDIDLATLLPHSAVRVFVMGDRAARREPATADDVGRMKILARDAIRAGALGIGTSRTLQHRTGRGESIPTLGAEEAELKALTTGMRDAGHGYLEIAMDFDDLDNTFAMLKRVVVESGRPCMIAIGQLPNLPHAWRQTLDLVGAAAGEGLPFHAQTAGRPIGMLMGHELSCNPFSFCATYRELADLPFAERIARLRDPEIRARILSEPLGKANEPALERMRPRLRRFDRIYALGNPPLYEPPAHTSMIAIAKARGLTPEEVAYDMMLEEDGRAMLYHPSANYVDESLDAVLEMLRHKQSVLALGDAGAHCGALCDASYTTFMLTHWSRDRAGDRLSLPEVVRLMTSATADAVGLHDRGRIRVGHKADINVIDYDRLSLSPPKVTYDLPGGGRRIVQHAEGFTATLVSGQVTYRQGEAAGSLPGRLVRGPQQAA